MGFLLFLVLAMLHDLWKLSSLTRDQTLALGSKNVEFQPLENQGIHSIKGFVHLANEHYVLKEVYVLVLTKCFEGVSHSSLAWRELGHGHSQAHSKEKC